MHTAKKRNEVFSTFTETLFRISQHRKSRETFSLVLDLFKKTLSVSNAQNLVSFWSVFYWIPIVYGDLLCKSPYSVRKQENTDQKKLRIQLAFTQWLRKTFPVTQTREYSTPHKKFSTTDFFSKWDQIHRKQRIWSHLLKKS